MAPQLSSNSHPPSADIHSIHLQDIPLNRQSGGKGELIILIFITMRKLLRSAPFSQITRAAVPEYRPEANDLKFKNWWARLNSLSSKPASKVYLAQLSNLFAYYNRQVTDTTKPIDFPAWKSKIITKGLVDSVQRNYEDLSVKEYDLDKVFNDIFSKDSKAIDDINNEMAFHTAVWLQNYSKYVQWLSEVETFGNINDYSSAEVSDFFPRTDPVTDSLIETHNYFPGAKDDTNLYGFMTIQFDWGKRIVTYFAHPSTDNKGGRATKNTMGR